jgi:hypothetical protein
MGSRYVVVEVPDEVMLQLPPGISSIAALEEGDFDLIKAALWSATDLWWSAARDEACAMSDELEDRLAAMHSLEQAQRGEKVMRRLGHKWLPEHFEDGADEAFRSEQALQGLRERLGLDVAARAKALAEKKSKRNGEA